MIRLKICLHLLLLITCSFMSFDESPVLSYLGLPNPYDPSPRTDPITFLLKHLKELPPHLLAHFTSITTPKQRTIIPTIRNRRLKHTCTDPSELSFASAKYTWPSLWQGREPFGLDRGKEEEEWVQTSFLEGSTKHVGKLGSLLGGYEEAREAERVRGLRRQATVEQDFIPEEDSESGEDESDDLSTFPVTESEAMEEAKVLFERLVKERFIYGLLDVSPPCFCGKACLGCCPPVH
jgi:hypothetical protein